MNKASKRYTRWLWVAVAGAGVALVIIAFLPVGGDLDIRAHVAKLTAEAKSRTFSRTVFRGKTTPGNAWDDYNVAMNDVLAIKEDPPMLSRFSMGWATEGDAAIARKIVAAHGVTLDRFRNGVRRENGQYPWKLGGTTDHPDTIPSRKLANLVAAQAKILSDGGRAREAMDLALDMTVFARDLAANGTTYDELVGAAVYSQAVDSLQITMLSGKLTPEDLKDLASMLESVERDMPDQGAAFANETLLDETVVLAISTRGLSSKDWLSLMTTGGGWRYGLSTQRIAADYLGTVERRLERMQKLGEMDFASAIKEAEALEAEKAASSNPMVRDSVANVARTLIARREVIARLRLLRAAALWGASGKAPKLADPLGTDLKMKEEDGKIRIWSVGRDGKDAGGTGSWNHDPSKPGDDIVLEFPKPPKSK